MITKRRSQFKLRLLHKSNRKTLIQGKPNLIQYKRQAALAAKKVSITKPYLDTSTQYRKSRSKMATMMRMVFTFVLMGHSSIQMATILTKTVLMSMEGTMMTNLSITSLGQAMKRSIMQSIRIISLSMEICFMTFNMRTKSLLQNNINLNMTTTILRQKNIYKKRERKSLKMMIMNLNQKPRRVILTALI